MRRLREVELASGMTPEEREKWAEQFRRRGFASLPFACLDIMQEYARAAVQAEREAWVAACREVAGWYPESIFDPDGGTLDAKSAAMARLTVKNIQETRARTAQGEGEGK